MYFQFHRNYKQLLVEAMSDFEIYFPIFSETIYTISKTFSQYGLRKCRQTLLQEKQGVRIFDQNFLARLSKFSKITKHQNETVEESLVKFYKITNFLSLRKLALFTKEIYMKICSSCQVIMTLLLTKMIISHIQHH